MTSLALVFMARPSDLAPKEVVFNPSSLSLGKTVLTTDDIHFNENGLLQVAFWGIKNDSKHQGFEVSVHSDMTDTLLDPVKCLKLYVAKIEEFRPKDTKPLLISLKPPYRALSSDTFGTEEAIVGTIGYHGIYCKIFSPHCRHQAMKQNILPETALQIGRWKTKEVFFNHYVYTQVPELYTGNLFDVKS